jgi:hypothetical protein
MTPQTGFVQFNPMPGSYSISMKTRLIYLSLFFLISDIFAPNMSDHYTSQKGEAALLRDEKEPEAKYSLGHNDIIIFSTIQYVLAGLHKIFYFLGPQCQQKYFLHANTGNLMFKFDH